MNQLAKNLLFYCVGCWIITMALASKLEAQTYYPTTTVYSPVGNGCVVPQASSRTVWRQVPVTIYQQVISVDPWTGQQIVYSQPMIVLQWQASQEAVTSCRPISADHIRVNPLLPDGTCQLPYSAPARTRAADNSTTTKINQIRDEIVNLKLEYAEVSNLKEQLRRLEIIVERAHSSN